jgi:hypothetical protein
MHLFEVSIGAKLDHLSVSVSKNSDLIDELDQDRRAKHIIVQGLPESPNITKSLHELMDKMGLFIPPAPHVFIDAAHRLGKERSAAELTARGPRPILVKFNNLTDRDSFYFLSQQEAAKRYKDIYLGISYTSSCFAIEAGERCIWSYESLELKWKNFCPG